jgi:hypothetical protein
VGTDDIQEWISHDKGHRLTNDDIVDVMSHAGISHLQGTEQVDTTRHSGGLSAVKNTLVYFEQEQE